MIIGIDIDDTLTYLQNIKIEFAEKYIKENNLPYKLINPNPAFLKEMFDWPIEECDKFWFAESLNMLSSAPARENASKVITKLKEFGHEIVIITARSSEWHEDPYGMSASWLTKNNIPFDKIIYGVQDKTQSCIDEKVDIFIDDMPNHLIKLQPLGIKTILMGTPHNENQNIYNGIRVKDWFEIEKYVYTKN